MRLHGIVWRGSDWDLVCCNGLAYVIIIPAGYLGLEDSLEPSHMGTLPTENMAAGFSATETSSRLHGTSNGESEQCSCALSKSGLAEYCPEVAL